MPAVFVVLILTVACSCMQGGKIHVQLKGANDNKKSSSCVSTFLHRSNLGLSPQVLRVPLAAVAACLLWRRRLAKATPLRAKSAICSTDLQCRRPSHSNSVAGGRSRVRDRLRRGRQSGVLVCICQRICKADSRSACSRNDVSLTHFCSDRLVRL